MPEKLRKYTINEIFKNISFFIEMHKLHVLNYIVFLQYRTIEQSCSNFTMSRRTRDAKYISEYVYVPSFNDDKIELHTRSYH